MIGTRSMRMGIGGAALVVLATLPIVPPARAQGTLSALQTDMDQIARRARPSVVTVIAQREVRKPAAPPGGEKRQRTRVGSGVAVEDHGVLTTASVVMGADRVFLRTANGIQVEAEVVGLDPISNLALIRAPSLRLPTLRFGRPGDAEVGSWV